MRRRAEGSRGTRDSGTYKSCHSRVSSHPNRLARLPLDTPLQFPPSACIPSPHRVSAIASVSSLRLASLIVTKSDIGIHLAIKDLTADGAVLITMKTLAETGRVSPRLFVRPKRSRRSSSLQTRRRRTHACVQWLPRR